MIQKNMVVSGKRKTAVAKATIKDGSGIVTLNKNPISSLPMLKQLEINEPIVIAKEVLGKLNFDIAVKINGGGLASQIEAARLAIARAIVKFTGKEDLRQEYLRYDRNMLIADIRRKEACKPGDSKARSMRQSSKR